MAISDFMIVQQYRTGSTIYVFLCPHCYKDGRKSVLEQADEGTKKAVPTKCPTCGKTVDTSGMQYDFKPYVFNKGDSKE